MSTLAATNLKHASSASNNIVLDTSGNVGIGTSSPGAKLTTNQSSTTAYAAIFNTPTVGLTAGNYVNMAYFANSRSTNNDGLRIVNLRDSTGSSTGNWETESYRIRRSVDQNDGSTGVQEEIVFGNNLLAFNTGGTERVRIDSSGNVGIGISSPGSPLEVAGQTDVTTSAAAGFGLRIRTPSGSGSSGILQFTNNPVTQQWGYISAPAQNVLTFGGNSEYARITSDGEFLVGVTSGGGGSNAGRVTSRGFSSRSGYNGSFSANVININWTGTAQLWVDTTNIGTFSFTSDYRIKRNIETQDQPALDRVLQLRPVTYQMADYGDLIKASDDIREGFIAHELAAVIPSAVSGEKDAQDQLQSLKLDALCSVLVKAIQELKADFDAYKAAHP